jgi:succinate dehydrogenase / fumarate reductase cytochrome b subunit
VNLRLDYLLFRQIWLFSQKSAVFACFFYLFVAILSPHLQIYRLPVAALLSISHRISGALSFVISTLLVWKVFFSFFLPSSHASWLINLFFSSYVGSIVLTVWFLCIAYHLCNGIRHLIWDLGKGFELFHVKFSNITVLVCSFAFFVMFFLLYFFS